MSNRRAQDERIEGTPDGSNAITEISDIPDTPTIGTATAGLNSSSITFTPATTGGTASTYTATSSPGSITGTSATSPVTVGGLVAGTSYTFTVRGSNSTGTSPASSASNSIIPADLVGSYDALNAVTLSSTATSVTFSGIPAGYRHLQIRCMSRSTALCFAYLAFNLDTTNANYKTHYLLGDGTSASSGAYAQNYPGILYGGAVGFGQSPNVSTQIFDILDYSSTNKNKTVRILNGLDTNGSGAVGLDSGVWLNSSSAISTITLSTNTSTFAQHSSFALYGVR